MIRRRQFLRYAQISLLTALGTGLTAGFQPYLAQSSPSLSIQWFGHTCFLFTGGGQRILVNPFRAIGCTAGYREPKVEADIVMISSRLLDEGTVEVLPSDPQLLFEPGVYQLENLSIQGIRTDHDRRGGRRFGINVAWSWTQAGVKILHLGGAAAPITLEQKILMGRPDVLLLPVGNGPKAYAPEEAKQAIQTLNPKLVIPTHYRTQAADTETCDIVPLEAFLTQMEAVPVRQPGSDSITVQPTDLPAEGPVIQVLTYPFNA